MHNRNRLAGPPMRRGVAGRMRTPLLLVMIAVFAALMAAPSRLSCFAADAVPAGYASLVQRVAPSVVTVMVAEQSVSAGQRAAEHANPEIGYDSVGELIRRLLAGGAGRPSADDRSSAALGSGFVIRADGLIVTNRHVIVGARVIRVRLTDARELPAKIVGADAVTDIALLKVDAGHLPALRLGSS